MIIKPPTPSGLASSRPAAIHGDTASGGLVLEVKASGGVVLEVGATAGVVHEVGATAAVVHDVGATAAVVLEVGASAGKILWRCDSWNFRGWRRRITGIVSMHQTASSQVWFQRHCQLMLSHIMVSFVNSRNCLRKDILTAVKLKFW